MPPPTKRKWGLVVVLVVSFGLAAWVASPIWIAILLGVVLATSLYEPYAALVRVLGERRAPWAAAIVTLASGLIVATVGTVVVLVFSNELMKLVAELQERGGEGHLEGILGERTARAIAGLGVDTARLFAWIRTQLESAASYAAALAAVVLRTTSHAVLGLIVALITMYYALREGPGVALRIERIAPLEPQYTRELLQEAREVGRTAFVGALLTAVVQGLLALVGFLMFGVPQPIAWALAVALGSFVPVIGTAIVWVPISGWLLLNGHPVRAALLVVWGLTIITSLADYVIRPRLVGSRGHGHPLLTLIALLGGLEVFGLAGLIIAPIVMSVFVAALRLYERESGKGIIPS